LFDQELKLLEGKGADEEWFVAYEKIEGLALTLRSSRGTSAWSFIRLSSGIGVPIIPFPITPLEHTWMFPSPNLTCSRAKKTSPILLFSFYSQYPFPEKGRGPLSTSVMTQTFCPIGLLAGTLRGTFQFPGRYCQLNGIAEL